MRQITIQDVTVAIPDEAQIFSERQFKDGLSILNGIDEAGMTVREKAHSAIDQLPLLAAVYLAPVVFGDYTEDNVRVTFIETEVHKDQGAIMEIAAKFTDAIVKYLSLKESKLQ